MAVARAIENLRKWRNYCCSCLPLQCKILRTYIYVKNRDNWWRGNFLLGLAVLGCRGTPAIACCGFRKPGCQSSTEQVAVALFPILISCQWLSTEVFLIPFDSNGSYALYWEYWTCDPGFHKKIHTCVSHLKLLMNTHPTCSFNWLNRSNSYSLHFQFRNIGNTCRKY